MSMSFIYVSCFDVLLRVVDGFWNNNIKQVIQYSYAREALGNGLGIVFLFHLKAMKKTGGIFVDSCLMFWVIGGSHHLLKRFAFTCSLKCVLSFLCQHQRNIATVYTLDLLGGESNHCSSNCSDKYR